MLSPAVAAELQTRLSTPRLAPYLSSSDGQIAAALELYVWNMRASGAFFESFHLLEVGLRNAIHDGLSRRCGREDWFHPGVLPLAPASQKIVATARYRASQGHHEELPGRVIAELPFGFWCFLLADDYNRALWQPYLRHIFPSARRRRLHANLEHLRRLRNRIAHHEPIHTHDLRADYQLLLGVASRVSEAFPDVISATSRVTEILDRRPTT